MKRSICAYGIVKSILILAGYMEPCCYYLFFNYVILNKEINLLPGIVFLYICVYLFQTFMSVLTQYIYNAAFPEMTLKMKEKILFMYTQMDIKQISEYNFSDLKTRLNDDAENAVQYYIKVVDMVAGVAASIIIIVLLFYFNIILASICMLMLPVSFWFTKAVSSRSNKAFAGLRDEQVNSNGFLFNAIQNWKEIKLYGLQKNALDVFSNYCDRIGKLYIKTHIYWFINRTFIAFKDVLVTKMSLYLIGGILIIKGYSEISVLLVFMQYYEKLINQVLILGDLKVKIGKEKESRKKVKDILEINIKKKENTEIDNINQIIVKNVYFSYQNKEKILKNINLTINKGSKIAIVGKSGCGKSTLLKLLAGITDPQTGKILMNTTDIRQIEQSCLYSKIGVIMQESYLFNLSIKENLCLSKEAVLEEEIWNVCEKARIKDFIMELDNGLDTVIGEKGIRLSGGQRQRLIIARMLLRNPDIIYFDEATSALDSENEFQVVRELMDLSSDKTLIIVAHNAFTIKDCDFVYFMDQGEIVDSGDHYSLMNTNQAYRKLWGSKSD